MVRDFVGEASGVTLGQAQGFRVSTATRLHTEGACV